MQIVGHVSGNKTVISKPVFEEKHIDFFHRYFKNEFSIIKSESIIIMPVLSMIMIERFIKAYEYEFGKW